MNMEKNSTVVKMEGDPAYHVMQRDDSHRNEDDYYN